LLWSYRTGGGVFNSVTVGNGAVYVGVGQTLLALNAKDGSLLWSFATSASIVDQVAVAYGMVYVNGGFLYALNAGNGSLVWGTQIERTSGTPVVSQAIVYSNIPGDYAFGHFSAFTGVLEIEDSATLNTFTVGGGILYLSSDSFITAINRSGTFFWSYATGAPVNSTAAVADGVLYEGADDGNLYALDASSGAYLWSFSFGFLIQVRSSPVVANGMVFLSGPDQNLYAFAVPSPPKRLQPPKISQLHPDLELTVMRSR
jgi:eukaryotic-like serine/threonine-protein kinase